MTLVELKKRLDALGTNPRAYNLDGGFPAESEGVVVAMDRGKWLVRFFERGSWYTFGEYDNEEAAADKAFSILSKPDYRT